MWLNKNTTPFTVIKKPKTITIGEVDYPKAIFSRYSEAELNAINIFIITEDSIPNRRYYTYVDELDETTAHITRTPIAKSVVYVQALMYKDLELTANSLFNKVTDGYAASEMASWGELEADAMQHQVEPLTSGMLYDEAVFANITVDDLATKVLTNASAFKLAKSYISGTRKKISLQIDTLINVDACILYEATPYDYIITAEDVANDIEGTLVEGDVVPRLKNNVKEW